jgi:dihydrolipoamide dehydrogenase
VAIIEKGFLGGTCSNWGCIPTKALYSSAKLLEEIQEHASSFGITINGSISGDFNQAVIRKNKIVEELRLGIEGLLKTRKISIFSGIGKVESGNITNGFDVSITKDVNITKIKGKRVIIATGSTPALIPAFNIDHKKIITSDDVLHPDFKVLPKSLLIIGAGVIGCEFANIFARFGVKVEMLEYLPSMLATEEKLVIKELQKKFEKLGIIVHTSINVLKVESSEKGVRAITCDASIPKDQIETAEKKTYESDLCLVSIGRSKQSSNLGLENLGAKIEKGSILINKETMETTIPGIYAIGDVNNVGIMLAHVASYSGDITVANALSGIGGFDIHAQKADFGVIPYTIFTSPEIGSVGLKEEAAKALANERNTKLYTGRFFYQGLGKAKCMGVEEGFMAIMALQDTDQIVGATCIGHEASELISEVTVAMKNNITATQLAHTIHSHPTISEIVLETVEDVHGMAIHKVNRRR